MKKFLTKAHLVILLVILVFGYLFYVGQKNKLVAARRREESAVSPGSMTQEQANQIAQQIAMMSSGIIAPSSEKLAEVEKLKVQLMQAGFTYSSTGYNTAVAVKKA